MTNIRNQKRRNTNRDPGGFVAMPWSVLDSLAYANLSHPARSLLIEIARQYVRNNNGRLLASRAYLAKRGWKSAAVIDRAKHELIDAGFLHETVKGHRPNKASWHALTFYTIDHHRDYDTGALETFRRSAYLDLKPQKIVSLSLAKGTERTLIVPSDGTERTSSVPSRGAMTPNFGVLSVPRERHLLDMPSTEAFLQAVDHQIAQTALTAMPESM